MKLTESLVNTVSSLCFGCVGMAFSATAFGTAAVVGLPALLGAGTVMGLMAARKQKHGIDSDTSPKTIRKVIAKEHSWSAAWTDKEVDIKSACDLLERHLRSVMLSPKDLAATATGARGRHFPEAATDIVFSALVKASSSPDRPSLFADEASGEAIFARAVIQKTFETAVLDKEYWAGFEPHLHLETARTAGKTLGVVERIEEKIDRSEKKIELIDEKLDQVPDVMVQKMMAALKSQGMFQSTLSNKTIEAIAARVSGNRSDLDGLVNSLINALDEAEALIEQGHNPGNDVDAFAASVIRRISDKLEAGDIDGASEEADAAFVQWEAQEKERAEASKRNGIAILKAGIRADIAASRPEAVADKEIRLIELTTPVEDQLNAIRVKFIQYYKRGRDKGIRIDLEIAIELARCCLASAVGPDEAGTAGNDLGNALQTLGSRETGTDRLEQAVTAYRNALEEYTRDRVPLHWARMQMGLGTALAELGSRETGADRLERAVTAYRSALEEYTRDRVPLDWARTQMNLGNALATLGSRETGTDRLEQAVTSYRNALEEYTRDRVPLDWARTQMNLGIALRTLGERESCTDRLEEAVIAYQNALKERTRDRVPLDWAMTQMNLGNALQTLGERESGTDRLEEAVTAYHYALKEWTRERVPLQWAATQNNLGNALWILGKRESGTDRLEEAVTAYHNALEERTRNRVPLDWAMTQGNLGEVYALFAEKDEDPAGNLRRAIDLCDAALKVYKAAGAEYYIDWLEGNRKEFQAKLDALRDGD